MIRLNYLLKLASPCLTKATIFLKSGELQWIATVSVFTKRSRKAAALSI